MLNAMRLQKVYVKRFNQQESSVSWLQEPLALRRKGSRLTGADQIWYMHNIREIEMPHPAEPMAEYFQIETHLGEELVVYQRPGQTGMKEVFLVAVSRGQMKLL